MIRRAGQAAGGPLSSNVRRHNNSVVARGTRGLRRRGGVYATRRERALVRGWELSSAGGTIDWMRPVLTSIVLLTISNIFMTFAWYAHLKELSHKPWVVAALVSWGIALFEYLFQVPANRIGFSVLSVAQLKILQEVITLTVFVPFALLYLKEPMKLDYVWAAVCILGAVYFIFRGR